MPNLSERSLGEGGGEAEGGLSVGVLNRTYVTCRRPAGGGGPDPCVRWLPDRPVGGRPLVFSRAAVFEKETRRNREKKPREGRKAATYTEKRRPNGGD